MLCGITTLYMHGGLGIRPQLPISDSALTLFILGVILILASLLLHFLFGNGGIILFLSHQIIQEFYIHATCLAVHHKMSSSTY